MSALILLGADMHAESDFAAFAFRPLDLLALAEWVEMDPDHTCLVADADGEVVGFFLGGVVKFFFGPDRHGYDQAFYVAPDYRGTRVAWRLFKAMAAFCAARGAVQLRFGAATGINPQVADRFLTGMGFVPAGTLYVRPI